jgi:cytochrome oxidase assembly protein ShyY1
VRLSAGSLVRAAVRPRLAVTLLVLLAAAGICGRLGVWQLDRAHVRSQVALEQRRAAEASTPPAALADVLAPQTRFDGSLVGRRVAVRGFYAANEQYLVSGRSLDGRTGYLVLTPLAVSTAAGTTTSGPPVLPVVRGWIPGPDGADLAPPSGEVAVTGFLQASEAAGMIDPVARTTDAISSGALANIWGGPIYTGYLVATSSEPAQQGGLTSLPQPTPPGGVGWNIQNLAYALQWWIFGGFALALWWRLVRDEAERDSDSTADAVAPGAAQ